MVCLLQLKSPGRTLFDMVCKHLNLLETDYFGLEYVDSQGVKVSTGLTRGVSLRHPVTRSYVSTRGASR